MKTYPEIFRAFYLEPLALEEGAMLTAHQYLWPRMRGEIKDNVFETEAAQQYSPGAAPSNRLGGGMAHMRRQMAGPSYDINGNCVDHRYYWSADGRADVAVIPMSGMLVKGAGGFAEYCMGACNPDRISHALAQAMADKDVKSIVIDANSPGGRTTAIPELAAAVRQAAQTRGKTVRVFSDQQIASAMEWVASQANEVIITPSAKVGSIGTYLAFLNPKVAMQTQGVSLEMFSRGTHKGIGLPGRELSQEDRKYLDSMVEKANEQFVSAVKQGRPKASEEALRDAKMYEGADAIRHGLADGLVSSWDEFLSLI